MGRSKSCVLFVALAALCLLISPAFAQTNLLTNGGPDVAGMTGWNIIQNGGAGWHNGGPDTRFMTSYEWCKRSQTIDLIAKGYTAAFLDSGPTVYVRENVHHDFEQGDYYIKVQLRNASHGVIQEWYTGIKRTIGPGWQWGGQPWVKESHTFANIPAGVRYIYFEDGGKDILGWGGHYGPKFRNAIVSIDNSPPDADFGRSLAFNDNGYIEIPAQNDINFSGAHNFTISMWVKPSALVGSQTLFHKHPVNGLALQIWFFVNDTGNLVFGLDKYGVGWTWVTSSNSLKSSRWSHVAAVKSGSYIHVYIDGQHGGSAWLDRQTSAVASAGNAGIGHNSIEPNTKFKGELDEFYLWNTDLNAAEISNWMYRRVDHTHPKYAKRVVYYSMNEGSGTTVSDLAGGNNNGTMVNMDNADWLYFSLKDWFTNEDTPLSGYLVGFDEKEGSSNNGVDWKPVFEIVHAGGKGTAAITSGNGFTYTPNLNTTGDDYFAYRIKDANGLWDKNDYVKVTINPVNDAPIAVNDSYSTNEDTALIVTEPGVLGNDIDVDGDSLTTLLVSGPAHGALTLNANGSFTYTPSANYNGPDAFTYRANDGVLDSNVATVSIIINPVNDPPSKKFDPTYTKLEDSPPGSIALYSLFSDIDGDQLTFIITNHSNPDLINAVIQSNSSLLVTLLPNAYGIAEITITAKDPSNASISALFTFIVNPVNDAPVAVNDNYSTNEDTALSVIAPGVLGNDSDVDGDSLSAVLVSAPAHGSLTFNTNGSFTYTPNVNYNGSDSFTYRVSDGSLNSNVATVSLNIVPVNDVPFTNVISRTPWEMNRGQGAIYFWDNNTIHGHEKDFEKAIIPQVDDAGWGPAPDPDTINFHETSILSICHYQVDYTYFQTFVFIPDNAVLSTFTISFSGMDDGVRISIFNSDYPNGEVVPGSIVSIGGTGTINLVSIVKPGELNRVVITQVDDCPTGNHLDEANVVINGGVIDIAIENVVVNEDAANSVIDLSDAFSDVDIATNNDVLTYTVRSNSNSGLVNASISGSNLSLAYLANQFGEAEILIRATDQAGAFVEAPVNVTVNPVNDAPVAANDSYITDEDTALTVAAPGVLGNDSDVEGDSLTAVLVSGTAHGTLTLNANGSFTYTPSANYNGSDSFTYKAYDGLLNSNTVTVSLTITPINDAPIAGFGKALDYNPTIWIRTPGHNDINFSGNSNFTFSTWVKPDSHWGDEILINKRFGAWTQLHIMISIGNGYPVFGLSKFNVPGTWHWVSANEPLTPNAWHHIAAVKSENQMLLYVNGQIVGSDAIDNLMDASISSESLYIGGDWDGRRFSGQIDEVQVWNVALSPSTINNWMFRRIDRSHPHFGNLVLYYPLDEGSGNVAYDAAGGNNNGILEYTTQSDWVDSTIQEWSTNEDIAMSGQLVGSDIDGSSTNGSDWNLTFQIVNQGSYGTAAITTANKFTYTPNANAYGVDTFSYRVSDGHAWSNTHTVNVTITPINDAPIIYPLTNLAANEGDTVTVAATFEDYDPTDTHTAEIQWGDGITTSAIVSGYNIMGSHVYVNNGAYTMTVTVTDSANTSHSQSSIVIIDNLAPIVYAGNGKIVNEGDLISLDPATFTDAGSADTHSATIDWGDGSPVDVGAVTQGPGTGSVAGSHVYADNGEYTVSVTVTDDDGATHADTLTVTVNNVAPVVAAGVDQTADEGAVVSLAPATFSDAGTADTHTATIDWGDGSLIDSGVIAQTPFGPPGSTAGQNGTISGSHVYADNGIYSVTVTVTDDEGASHADTLLVTVSNVAPVVTAGEDQTADEGAEVTLAPATFTDAGAADTHTATIDWGDGTAIEWGTISQSPFGPPGSIEGQNGTVSGSHIYIDNNIYSVTVTVTDDDGASNSASFKVTVNNVNPVVDAGNDQTTSEGAAISLDPAEFTDASIVDVHTAVIEWGDGIVEAGDLNQDLGFGSIAGSHVYADNGVYSVTITVTDDDLGVGSDTITVVVNNVNPIVEAGTDKTINESDTISLDPATFSDLGTLDTHTAVIDWGDDSPVDTGIVSQSPFGPPGSTEGQSGIVSYLHAYLDNGTYSVTVELTDDDGGAGSDTFTVTVNNVAPTCGPITGLPNAPTLLGTEITASAEFTDPGTKDTHTAVWDWGNGVTSEGTVTETNGSGSVSGSYIYPVPGIYPITLTVTDKDDDSCTTVAQYYVVIYDPDGGFITGGGWIQPEANAVYPEGSGRGEFGFSAKYVKNQLLPVGGCEFTVDGSKFTSTAQDWLVVDGNRAKFMGSGQINDTGDYAFIVTAIDNGQGGNDTQDQFRIRIWDKAWNQLVYDNRPGEPDHSYAAEISGNGSIQFHKNEEQTNNGGGNDTPPPSKPDPKDKGKSK